MSRTLPLPISVSFMGQLDWGPVIGAYIATLFLAGAYAWLGRHEEALDVLDAHISPPREFGRIGMREDPLYRDLRGHPRFQALLRKQGTAEEQIAEIPVDDYFPGPGLPPTVPAVGKR